MAEDDLHLGFSGGGLRASYYCLGGYRRLVELGLDHKVQGITSVSGGSITAGAIMTALAEGPFTDIDDFDQRVTNLLIQLGEANIRRKLFWRLLIRPHKWWAPRMNLSSMFPDVLKEELYGTKKLKALPQTPLWNCNTACLNTMKGFQFNVHAMEGEKLGRSSDIDQISVAFAVAVSAAFPMIFAPVALATKSLTFEDQDASSYPDELPKTLYLTDGGIFDNLGAYSIVEDEGDFITMDASSQNTVWPPDYKSNVSTRTLRILNISMSEIIYLRRDILEREDHRRGIQLILEEKANEIIEDQHEKGRGRHVTQNDGSYEKVEELASLLRTDLDAFNEIERDVLQWMGAYRMDIALKSLYPDQIPEENQQERPNFPFEDITYVEKVLKQGEKRVLW